MIPQLGFLCRLTTMTSRLDFWLFLFRYNCSMHFQQSLAHQSSPGKLLLKHYSRQTLIPFTEELEFLQQWLQSPGQSAILLTGEPQSGKKCLLHSLIRETSSRHPNWLLVPHFASVTPVYSSILYQTMVTLRSHFGIEQRVDLNQQKLRRYFKYWLEVVSEHLEKEYLGYQEAEVPQVVIIIQGVDLCRDHRGHLVESQFWLPSRLPAHVKLILTALQDDPFLANHCQTLRHSLTSQRREQILQQLPQTIRDMANRNPILTLHELSTIRSMQQLGFNPSKQDFLSILSEYVSFKAQSQLTEDTIRSVLYSLTVSRQGLTSNQVVKLVNLRPGQWQLFKQAFQFLLVEVNGHFSICDKNNRAVIEELVDPKRDKRRTYRLSIVRLLRGEPCSVGVLEQMLHQLLQTENYAELKEIVSKVEHFILLYTPLSKELLCQCWVRLEQLQQFDPVFEYNRAIEAYTSHYYPQQEELYRIIFQMSLFFKEYAQFQNPRTPVFRHPLIKGENDHLSSIGIFEELTNLKMVGKCKVYKLKPLEKSTSWKATIATKTTLDGRFLKKTSARKNSGKKMQQTKREAEEHSASTNRSKQGSERLIVEQEDCVDEALGEATAEPAQDKTNIEELNVGILSNQEKFRQHFLSDMREYLQGYFVPLRKGRQERELAFEDEDSENDEESMRERAQVRADVEKTRNSLVLKQYRQYLEESYHKQGQQVQFYYYKQWIWLQFPWLCQTVKHVYSQMLHECMPGSIHFMSPTTELALIKQALRITRAAKQSKDGIYHDKALEILPIRLKDDKKGESKVSVTRRSIERQTVASSKRLSVEASSRLRVDTTTLDQEILRYRQQEHRIKGNYKKGLKGDSSMPNLSTFVTACHQKESRILPMLQSSKGREKENRDKELTRDYTMLIRKYNELKHENDMLLERIEEARRADGQADIHTQEQVHQTAHDIEQLKNKKQTLEKNHKNQLELRKKLEVIIKICDLNKMYGSETDYLSSYLDSLKRMVHTEEDNLQTLKDSIQGTIEEGKSAVKDLRSRKKQSKAAKQKIPEVLKECLSRSSSAECVGLVEEEMAALGRNGKQKSKKARNVKDNSQDYSVLEELGLVYGSPENDQKIEAFADQYSKLRQLQLKNSELQQTLQKQREGLSVLRACSRVQLQDEARERELRTAREMVEKNRLLCQLKARNALLAQALLALSE